MNPKYTIKFYCDTTNQDEEKDIKEITLMKMGNMLRFLLLLLAE